MKVHFLGTSHGVPSNERFCSITLIESGGSLYLVDAGAPVIDLMLRAGFDLNRLKAIFITHTHGDHVNGLVSLVDLSSWYFREMSYDIYTPEAKLEDAVRCYADFVLKNHSNKNRIRFKPYEAGIIYKDENITVTAAKTEHTDSSYSFVVEGEGKRAIFTGDMSGSLDKKDYPEIAMSEKSDLVVCEMAHFGIGSVKPYLEKTKTGKFVFTHVYPFAKFDDIEKAAKSGEYPFEIYNAYDGLTIEV